MEKLTSKSIGVLSLYLRILCIYTNPTHKSRSVAGCVPCSRNGSADFAHIPLTPPKEARCLLHLKIRFLLGRVIDVKFNSKSSRYLSECVLCNRMTFPTKDQNSSDGGAYLLSTCKVVIWLEKVSIRETARQSSGIFSVFFHFF